MKKNRDKDLDRFIDEAREAEERSHGLWRTAYGCVREVLEAARAEGRTAEHAAGVLERSAGSRRKGEPTAVAVLRQFARRIRTWSKGR